MRAVFRASCSTAATLTDFSSLPHAHSQDGREPGLVLLILLMGASYAVAAPLILPFALTYMLTG
jgi:hypothetical protein